MSRKHCPMRLADGISIDGHICRQNILKLERQPQKVEEGEAETAYRKALVVYSESAPPRYFFPMLTVILPCYVLAFPKRTVYFVEEKYGDESKTSLGA